MDTSTTFNKKSADVLEVVTTKEETTTIYKSSLETQKKDLLAQLDSVQVLLDKFK
jgi:hypothetical protein